MKTIEILIAMMIILGTTMAFLVVNQRSQALLGLSAEKTRIFFLVQGRLAAQAP